MICEQRGISLIACKTAVRQWVQTVPDPIHMAMRKKEKREADKLPLQSDQGVHTSPRHMFS